MGVAEKSLVRVLAGMTVAASIGSAPVARADLITYGYSNARFGSSPRSAGISMRSARKLQLAWTANVGGAVNGQPVVVDQVRVGRRVRNLVLLGTGHGRVVALDAVSGAVLWRHRVGTLRLKADADCQASPDGVFGVFGTLAVDRKAGRVYAVDAAGRAWALGLASGKVVRGWPVSIRGAAGDFYWGGLALSRGRLYVAVASLCDVGLFDGGVVAVDIRHPRRAPQRWLTVPGPGAYGGGIWGWGGVSIDRRTGDVYAATGNSLGTAREDEGFSEGVVRLSASLALEQSDQPLHPPYVIGDRDFGTTPVLIDAPGCPPQLVAINKDGELLLYDRDRISSGPSQRLWVAANSTKALIPLYGVPAFDPRSRTLVLVSPSTPSTPGLKAGVQALTLNSSCRFAVRWWRPFDPPDAGSDPTISGGVIYIASGRNGFIRAFALRDGSALWSWRPTHGAIFAAPAVDGGTLYEAGWNGRVWAFRPGR